MPDNPIILDIQGNDDLELEFEDSEGLSFDTEPFSKGDPGKSAYQVAVDNGFSGTEEEWLASLVGPQGPTGATGPAGNGVASVALISTVGLVKTYRMAFTNGTYVDFSVTDGDKGDTGDTGPTGNGIASVTLVSTVGKVKTYRILFTNGTYTDFTVTDGADGSDGTDGSDGADGYSPTATVTKSGSVATITITDKNGTTTATVSDGVGDVESVNGKTGAVVLDADDVGAYALPSGGIPKTDLASDVKTSLGKADTALQSYTETDPVFTASAANGITASDISNWNDKQDALTAGDGINITTSIISNTQGIEYIVGTQVAATNAWTGVSTDTSLKVGKIIAYYLPYAGTSTAATLQLTMADGTTTAAIDIKRQGDSTVTTHFAVDNVIIMIYDGTYWKVSGYYYSDSNYVPTGYCTTAASTAAKVATCTYGYRDDPTYFPCVFRYANTATNATLQITSYANTASAIYVNGARTSSSNSFGRGVVLFLYYNNAYYCYNDGRFPIVVNGAVTSIQDQLALYTPTASLATVATSGDYSDLSNTPSLATVATSGSYNDLSNTPSLATVATSGSYADLSNKPTIPTVPTKLSGFTDDLGSSPTHTHSQYLTSYTETDPVFTASVAHGITSTDISNWNGKSDFSGDYNDLSNKPTIPTVPTNVSAFTNDAGYLTSYTETDPVFTASASAGISSSDISAWNGKPDDLPDLGVTASASELNVLDGITASTTELNYTDGVTSNIQDQLDTMAKAVSHTASGSIASFNDGTGDMPLVDLVVDIDPVQSGSGDPSPNNIRPITGWTGVTVNRSGTNLIDQDVLLLGTSWVKSPESLPTFAGQPVYYGTLSNLCGNGETLANAIPVTFKYEENTRYRVCYWWKRATPSTANGLKIQFHYTDGTSNSTGNQANNTSDFIRQGMASSAGKTISRISLTYNSSSNVYIAGFAIEKYDGNQSDLTAVVGNEIQTIPIDWTTEAGTVYGGSLDVTTGVLTVTDDVIASYNGETLPSTWISDRDVYASDTTPTTGAQVVYKLATAQTYQLAPQEVRTLLGINSVWANTGDSTVKYIDIDSDLSEYFVEKSTYKSGQLLQDRNLAYVESGSKASRAYSVGDCFVNSDGVLCKITATVPSGGTLTAGTNYDLLGGYGGLASLFNVEVDNDPCNTLSSPFTSPLFSLVLIRCGKIRILTGDLSASSSTSSGATITTLKNAKDYPITDVLATTGNGGTGSLGLRITPSGSILTYGSASSSRTYQAFSIVYCV